MDDLEHDSLLQYQRSNYILLTTIVNFIIPTFVSVFFFNHSIVVAWHMNMMRILILLHWSLMINSLGNFIGKKPYNKDIAPKNSDLLSLFGFGEGEFSFHTKCTQKNKHWYVSHTKCWIFKLLIKIWIRFPILK